MNQSNVFAPHEVMELHELIVGEVTAVQKMQAMMGLIHDQTLEDYIQSSLQMKQQRIAAFENLMTRAQNTSF